MTIITIPGIIMITVSVCVKWSGITDPVSIPGIEIIPVYDPGSVYNIIYRIQRIWIVII